MHLYNILPQSVISQLLLGVCISAIFLRLVIWLLSDNKLYPPGPFCLPIVGYLPFLGKVPHETLHKLSEKYGGVFGLYFGNRYVVVLGNYKAMKEAYSKSELLFRPENSPMKFAERKISMSTCNGEFWRQQKRFILQQLKDLGFGKNSMEKYIKIEIRNFLQEVDKTKNEPFDFRNLLTSSISNNIVTLLLGKRYEYDDPKREFLNRNVALMLASFSQTAVHSFIPWITPFLIRFGSLNYDKARKAVGDVYHFVQEEINNHKKNLDSTCVRDFVDGYLVKMQDSDHSCDSSFTMDMLQGNVHSLLSAGSEPVIVTIEWYLLILAEYQDVQKKLQQEIDNVIGSERTPCWNDRSKMFYTQAVILETQRWRPPTPISLLRCAEKEVDIQGYHIPKGTIILANIWGIHNDHSCWKKADKFDPTRFLNEEGTGILKKDGYVPFSLGKRSCPGEALANMETFLYITSIFQRYKVSFPEGSAHTLQGHTKLSFKAIYHTLCFTRRS